MSLKVLLVGGCGGLSPSSPNLDSMVAKLEALNVGKAGPFDVVLVSGPLFPPNCSLCAFPIPTYFYDGGSLSSSLPSSDDVSSDPVEVASNLFYFPSKIGLNSVCVTKQSDKTTKKNLTISYLHPRCPPSLITSLISTLKSAKYVGSDFTLTDLPQGSPLPDTLVPGRDLPKDYGSADPVDLLLPLRPRYSVYPLQTFHQVRFS